MEEFVEIGALVAKSVGDGVYEKIYNLDGVEYVFLETGRSNDLFSDRQFGEYGEAALLSVVVKSRRRMMYLVKYLNFLVLMKQALVSCLKSCLLYTSPSPRDE